MGTRGGNFWEAAEPGGRGGNEGREREVEELLGMKWRRACSTYSSLRQDSLRGRTKGMTSEYRIQRNDRLVSEDTHTHTLLTYPSLLMAHSVL